MSTFILSDEFSIPCALHPRIPVEVEACWQALLHSLLAVGFLGASRSLLNPNWSTCRRKSHNLLISINVYVKDCIATWAPLAHYPMFATVIMVLCELIHNALERKDALVTLRTMHCSKVRFKGWWCNGHCFHHAYCSLPAVSHWDG